MTAEATSAAEALTAELTTLLDHYRASLLSAKTRGELLDLASAAQRSIAMVHALQLETIAMLDQKSVDHDD